MNHAEVVEEDRRLKLPANHEAKRKRADWILQDDEKKKVWRTKSSYNPSISHFLLSNFLPNCSSFSRPNLIVSKKMLTFIQQIHTQVFMTNLVILL